MFDIDRYLAKTSFYTVNIISYFINNLLPFLIIDHYVTNEV
jgi:hypothetical protein